MELEQSTISGLNKEFGSKYCVGSQVLLKDALAETL